MLPFQLVYIQVFSSPYPHQQSVYMPQYISTLPRTYEPNQPVQRAYAVSHQQATQNDLDKEDDFHRLQQRQKQINYGYATEGYQRYRALFPRSIGGETSTRSRPCTPDIQEKSSKRVWDKKVKAWRRGLHKYDTTPCDGFVIQPGCNNIISPNTPLPQSLVVNSNTFFMESGLFAKKDERPHRMTAEPSSFPCK